MHKGLLEPLGAVVSGLLLRGLAAVLEESSLFALTPSSVPPNSMTLAKIPSPLGASVCSSVKESCSLLLFDVKSGR